MILFVSSCIVGSEVAFSNVSGKLPLYIVKQLKLMRIPVFWSHRRCGALSPPRSNTRPGPGEPVPVADELRIYLRSGSEWEASQKPILVAAVNCALHHKFTIDEPLCWTRKFPFSRTPCDYNNELKYGHSNNNCSF